MLKPTFTINQINDKEHIFDIIRRKYVVLTREEWVRQHIIHHMVFQLHYPKSLISVEKQIQVGSLKKRYDIVVYAADKPWLIVECKREDVEINQRTLQQVFAYTSQIKPNHIAVSNGAQIFCLFVEENKWYQHLPVYPH